MSSLYLLLMFILGAVSTIGFLLIFNHHRRYKHRPIARVNGMDWPAIERARKWSQQNKSRVQRSSR